MKQIIVTGKCVVSVNNANMLRQRTISKLPLPLERAGGKVGFRGLFLFFLLTISITTCFSQTRYYVSATGSPTGNALSWTTACNDLQLVINNAAPYDTIWVAQGTYVPIRPADSLWKVDSNNRDNAFTITKGLCLYGGFTGNETDISQRTFPTQGSNGLSVLSGDIGILNDSTDNTYNLVLIITQSDTVLLDGFTITRNKGEYIWGDNGIFVNGKYIGKDGSSICCSASSLKLNNMSIIRNASAGGIPAIESRDSSSLIVHNSLIAYNHSMPALGLMGYGIISCSGKLAHFYNTTIIHNITLSFNSSVLLVHLVSSCILSQVQIISNLAIYDATLKIGADTCLLSNVLIANNISQHGRAGIHYVGGSHVNKNGFYYITNSTIANNYSAVGDGAINNNNNDSLTLIYVRNSIIWGNKGYNHANRIVDDYNQSKNTIYSNCLLGRTLNWDSWMYQYMNWLPTPPGAIIADPLFVDTTNRDYRLQCGSPAVNMGNNAFFHPDSFPNLSHIFTDLDGNPRFFNNGTVDIGAYELQQACKPFIILPQDTTICQGDSIDIAITLSGTAPWDLVYTSNSGQSYDTIKNITINPYLWRISPQDSTLYVFTQITDMYFDTLVSDSITVSVIAMPVLSSVLTNDTLCSGEQTKAVVFEGISDNYQWEAKGDTINYIPNDVQTGDFGSYKVENTDTFPLSTTIRVMPYVTVSNKTCYGLADSFSITVRPVIQLEAGVNDSLFCEGDSILFVLFNTGVSDVVWQGNETILDEENAVIPNAKPAHSGMYVVRARKSNYCILPDTVQITVLSAVITDMDDTLYMCDWEDIMIYSNATNADDYLWNTGETSTNINVSNPGTYYVEATNERCIVFDTVEVIQIQVSEFTISSSGDLCDGKDVELTATIDNVSYQWNTGDTSKTIIVSVEGFYSVTIEAGHCQAYKELEINCPCKIVLPNVFTPVQGRTYLPIVDFTLNSYSMHIYDRWGNIVFQTNSLSPWDGTNKGKPVSDGVYYCVVSYTCTDMPEKILTTQSSITVMR